jgi:hypothetical protein
VHCKYNFICSYYTADKDFPFMEFDVTLQLRGGLAQKCSECNPVPGSSEYGHKTLLSIKMTV